MADGAGKTYPTTLDCTRCSRLRVQIGEVCYNWRYVGCLIREPIVSDNFKPDIWQLQSQFNIQGLIRALGNEDKNIRKRAAAALRTMGAKEALPALRAAFAAEEDANTRMIIATAIEMLRGEPGEEQAPPRVQT